MFPATTRQRVEAVRRLDLLPSQQPDLSAFLELNSPMFRLLLSMLESRELETLQHIHKRQHLSGGGCMLHTVVLQ
jgi:hypothetical protein